MTVARPAGMMTSDSKSGELYRTGGDQGAGQGGAEDGADAGAHSGGHEDAPLGGAQP